MDYRTVVCSVQLMVILAVSGINMVTITRPDEQNNADPPSYTSDRVLTVTTILIVPYASLKTYNNSGPLPSTQDMYEGYIVDLMDLIAEVVGFKYRLIPVYDGTFGYKKPDGTWDGMIGELTRKEADIAAGPMYITEERQRTVDFTRPFMDIHASMIMRKPQFGGPTDIQTVPDLLHSADYSYGTLNRGIIRKSLRTTNSSLYKLLYETMKHSEIYSFTRTNEEGIERVRTDKYVYILPDKIATYVTQQKPCDLSAVGSFLIQEHFGLAVPKGSALLTYLDRAIDLLRRRGDLQRLYQKWWFKDGQCPTVQSSKIFSLSSVGFSHACRVCSDVKALVMILSLIVRYCV